jgi:putative transposase
VAAFISSQRTEHGVPHAVTCRALGLSESWFYKWRDRRPTPRQRRRADLAVKIREIFDASGGTYGSPRVTLDLRPAGCGLRAAGCGLRDTGSGRTPWPG